MPIPQAGSTRIVFTSNRDGRAQIYSMDANGGNLIRLTNNGSNDDHPRWSPNGTKILFQSDRDSTPPSDPENPGPTKQDIYVMNADGTGQTRLTTDAADDCNAEWSPDGSKITFQSLRNGAYYQVYSMNASGSAQLNLSNGATPDTQPSWSPNGSQIVFASERDHAGTPGIYVMNANGSNQIRLTFTYTPFKDEQAVWSRDGMKLAFVSTRDSVVETWQETDDDGGLIQKSAIHTNKEIYLMNADGSNQVRLTNTLENDDSPFWSPDSTKIVFRSERERDAFDPTPQLWTMNADGTNQAAIAGNVFGDSSPGWTTSATGNQSPIASSGGPYSGLIAQNVAFSAAASFDPDGSITSYAWNFGDGGTGSGVTPTHAYATAGTYNISLTVTDDLGTQTTANTTATITAAGSDQYLANFNLFALGRAPYASESSYWNDILRAAYPNGQTSMLLSLRELGKTLFESSAYAARGRNNHWYVYDLYKTYLMREPDVPGWAFWESAVPTNGRENVRRAFDECGEFAAIVATLTPSGAPSSNVSSLASARVDPFNQPGNGLASRDAEWSVSLLNLPGRAGLDLGLSLSYSSMVWTHSGPYIYFDEDNGWPSPGFRLGFPTIQQKVFDAQARRNVYLMVTGGSRVSLRQLGTSSTYEAADSSYLQLIDYGGSLLVRTTDGTQLTYQSFNNEWRCTQIKDRNGNYISVNYDWLGHITTIIDTLARTITFNYDTNANLTSITQSWTVNGTSQTHTWASFGWSTKTIQPSFSGVMVVGAANPSTIPVVNQVGLDDGSRYTFEYNAAGQANLIRSYRSDNIQRAYTAYDYDAPPDDCPRLIGTRVSAENWTGINGVPSEVATQYADPGNGSHTVTSPDGTLYKEFYGTGYKRGLPTQSEVWSGGIKQKWTTNDWIQDDTGVTYQTNPRVIETNVFDASGNRRRTTVSYAPFTLPSGASCPLPSDTREYAADATTALRHMHVDYRMDPNLDAIYVDRHILGLIKEQTMYEVSGGTETLMSRVGFAYDDPNSIQGNDAPVRHDNDSYGATFVAGRANLSSMKRYNVTDSSVFTVSSSKYNTAGAIVDSIDPLSHHTTLSYVDSFSDGNNARNTLAYPKTVTNADGYSSTLIYNFDFGAVTRKQTPQPNTIQNIPGPVQTMAYDAAGRLDRMTSTVNNAYTRYVYGPNYVQTFASVNNVADEAYSNTVFDGLGRTVVSASNHPGSDGGYSAVNTIYDAMARTVKQSNPTETDGSWIPSGDDVYNAVTGEGGWRYTQQTYDWKGRPLVTTNQDGTTKEASYRGCGCAGGEVVTLTDEGTIDAGVLKRRQQKIYSDVLGRTVKTELLNWQGGSVYSTSVNSYNARDQITLARQYQGPEADNIYQQTTMTYDGYGRLKTSHAPEQQVDPNNSASTDHTTWDYFNDDTIQKLTDARGASATYAYNNRRLPTGVVYAVPGGSAIPVPGPVTFAYDAAGNRTSMSDGSGSVSYQYNQLSQLTSETRQFAYPGPSGSYTLSYDYNLAGSPKSITDPSGATINYNYDLSGRMTAVTGSSFGGVTQYATNVKYRA
ncbi:MAG TPA: PKD domain-containing protein, partial [Pyrinomonadaceae bacterium]|nr:PKD domain-containing protein [Pyrinomonadaceae bacterium]